MGAWQEIVDYTVPSNTTSVVLDSFGTITKDDFVKIVTTFTANGSVPNDNIHMFANTATTNTQYHTQTLIASGSTITPFRTNLSLIEQFFTGQTAVGFIYLKISENDRMNAFSNTFKRLDSSTQVFFNYVTSSGATFPSGITSLTFTAGTANGLATGSRIQIYKLAAEKVADITVGSNTTQVDISNLSIDKDSEYLLVSDITNAVTNIRIQVFPNDLTTTSGYYTQNIIGNDGSAASGRENNATFAYIQTSGNNAVGYSHIKLSNIGAFTVQHYTTRRAGSTTIDVINNFVSSTAENILSITKLNIVADTTNAIAAGSRYQLYKLY